MRMFLVVLAGVAAQACDLPAVEVQVLMANQAIGLGRLAEARASLRAVIDGAQGCPQEPDALAIRAMVQLASVERLSGRLKEGLALASQAVSLAEQEPAANAALLADTLETLAQMQAAAGKYYDAEPVIQRAIETGSARAETTGSNWPLASILSRCCISVWLTPMVRDANCAVRSTTGVTAARTWWLPLPSITSLRRHGWKVKMRRACGILTKRSGWLNAR